MTDTRRDIYRDLHAGQGEQHEAYNRTSATRILGILHEYTQPKNVLDVGCGVGTWLDVASKLGAEKIRGIEGDWLDRSKLVIDASNIQSIDLEKSFDVGETFDIVFCLEVAEHISEESADVFIESLTRHADMILFSAAIPYQGGHHHVNERFPDYWAERFAKFAFRPLDFIRPQIWLENEIAWPFRQNIILFAHDRAIAANEKLRAELEIKRPLSIVHPQVYVERLQAAQQLLQQHGNLLQHLSQGGTFNVARGADGNINVTKQA